MIEVLALYFGCTRIERWLGPKGSRTVLMKVTAVLAYIMGAAAGAFTIDAVRVLRDPYAAWPFASGFSVYLASVVGGILALGLVLLAALALRRTRAEPVARANELHCQ